MNHLQNNKFESNKKYFTICVYAVGLVLICALIIRAIFLWDETTAMFRQLGNILAPFAVGAFMAFILSPLVKWIEKRIFLKKRYGYGLSVLVTYLLVIGIIVIAIQFIIPQVGRSIRDLAVQVPSWYQVVVDFIIDMEEKFPYLDYEAINKEIETFGKTLFSTDNIRQAVQNVLPVVFSTSMSVVSGIFDAIIALIVSVYLLIDKNLFIEFFRKCNQALFSKETGSFLAKTVNEFIKIFGGFMSGKLVDSLIIGVICFVAMNILQLPYAMIISIIVGITNMIPYFGPFIGAVPGGIILLMISPLKMLIYLVLILVLQQFDGLYLGPKILGDSVGVRPVWIVFGVTVGGSVAGVFGMLVGVPVVAFIGYLLKEWLDYRLRRKKQEGEVKNEAS